MKVESDIKLKTFLLFGAPGCGKGTQGKVLGSIPGHKHIACGDVFRALDLSTDVGRTFLEYSSKGELVPDDITVTLWADFIKRQIKTHTYNPEDQLLILDGIPRNPEQAKLLDEHIEVLGIIHLSVKGNWDVLAERLKRRALKENRLDDANMDTIKNRLQIYKDESKPLLHHYPEEISYEVNALQTPMEVLTDVIKIIQVANKFRKTELLV